MNSEQETFTKSLNKLTYTVNEAVNTFPTFSEELCAEGQTAKEVLSHLVFWHREYVHILGALLSGRPPDLRAGKFRELNELAYAEFRDRQMIELVALLSDYQEQLESLVKSGFDPHLRMPVKQGSNAWGVLELMDRIEAHIRSHLLRLKKAQRVSYAIFTEKGG